MLSRSILNKFLISSFLKFFNNFIKYSNKMNDIYENIKEYNRNK